MIIITLHNISLAYTKSGLNKPKPIPDYLLIKDIQLGVAGPTTAILVTSTSS